MVWNIYFIFAYNCVMLFNILGGQFGWSSDLTIWTSRRLIAELLFVRWYCYFKFWSCFSKGMHKVRSLANERWRSYLPCQFRIPCRLKNQGRWNRKKNWKDCLGAAIVSIMNSWTLITSNNSGRKVTRPHKALHMPTATLRLLILFMTWIL